MTCCCFGVPLKFWKLCRKVGCSVVLVFAFTAIGCADSGDGAVRGSVTFNGQPLSVGNVNLYNKQNGVGATAELDEKGEFSISGDIRPGDYLVYFSPPEPPMPVMENADNPTPLRLDLSKYPDIPRKYRSQTTTDYIVKVSEGNNVLDLKVP